MGYKIKRIYQGTNLVRPVWKPGADTICYYPLTDDYKDASGNCSDIVRSNTSSQIGTYHGVKCFNMNNYYSTISTINNMNNVSSYTWNFWGYLSDSINGFQSFDIMFRQSTDNWGAQGFQVDGTSTTRWRYGNPTNKNTTFTRASSNNWHNYCITLSSGALKIYIDGTVVSQLSSGAQAAIYNATPLVIGGNYSLYNVGDGCLSQFIIEKVGWTAQEVSDYYNQTKSKYGL